MTTDLSLVEFDRDAVVDGLADYAWPQAIGAGAAAFVVGYLLVILLVVLGPGSVDGGLVGVLVLIAFVFYSAHNVPAVVDGTREVSYLAHVASPTTPDPSLPVGVYYAVPVAVVLATGAIVAARYCDDDGAPADALATALGVSVGYVLVAVLGTVVFRTPALFGGYTTVKLEAAAAYGFVYPLAFVTLAAAAVQFVRYLRVNVQA